MYTRGPLCTILSLFSSGTYSHVHTGSVDFPFGRRAIPSCVPSVASGKAERRCVILFSLCFLGIIFRFFCGKDTNLSIPLQGKPPKNYTRGRFRCVNYTRGRFRCVL